MTKFIKITFNIIGSIIALLGFTFIFIGGFGGSSGYMLLGIIMLFSGIYIVMES